MDNQAKFPDQAEVLVQGKPAVILDSFRTEEGVFYHYITTEDDDVHTCKESWVFPRSSMTPQEKRLRMMEIDGQILHLIMEFRRLAAPTPDEVELAGDLLGWAEARGILLDEKGLLGMYYTASEAVRLRKEEDEL